jgi:phosphoribosylcarboxyaminoimidazole (NCAIR) mutase
VPVATMGLGKSGASNAALLAIQILSLKNPSLARKLEEYREKMSAQIEAKSKKIQQKS